MNYPARSAIPSEIEAPIGLQLFIEFVRDFAEFVGRRKMSAGLFLFFGALLEGVGLLLLVPLISLCFGAETGDARIDYATKWISEAFQATSPFSKILLMLCLLLVVLAARAFVILRRDVLLSMFSVGFVEAHRVRMIRLLAQSPWASVAQLRHGRITHLLGSDVEACGAAATMLLKSAVSASLLFGQMIFLAILSPMLVLAVPILLISCGLAIRPVLRRAGDVGRGLTEAKLSLVTSTTQFLGGLKLALSQGLQKSFLQQFEIAVAQATVHDVEFVRQYTVAQLTLSAAGAAIGGLLLLFGVGIINAAPAVIIPVLFLVGRMTAPLTQLQSAAQHIFHSLPAYAKVKKLQSELEGTDIALTRPFSMPTNPLSGSLEFHNVSFWHREGNFFGGAAPGVFSINLAIEQGSFIGVTGASGAGKSTFCDLLVGLYAPARGYVSVAGQKLEGEVLKRWQASLSYVVQDAFLFHDTLRNNLLWARVESSEDELWSALAFAGADDLVRAMEAQLDTVVGERGALLSGGERQRIALARAMLRRPNLLILDEATNAIDVNGETEILNQLSSTFPRPTVLIVAHRASSLQFCDRILQFNDGRLVR